MLFKLLGIERAQQQQRQESLSQSSPSTEYAPSAVKPYRQIFLTQSHILAKRVQEYYGQLVRDTASFSTRGTVDAAPNFAVDDAADLLDLDEEAENRHDLPSKFSDLQDMHYPLFITFDQVCVSPLPVFACLIVI